MFAASAGVHVFHHSDIPYYVSFMGVNMIVINSLPALTVQSGRDLNVPCR
jgi:hypothetical protein